MTFQVPKNTSVNTEEFTPEAYTIAFAPELIEFILEGQKVTTYRLGNKYDYLNIGDVVSIQDSQSKAIVCKSTIKNKARTTFLELPIANGTHEPYSNKEQQREILSGYYAYIGRPIRDEDIFLAFEFKLL